MLSNIFDKSLALTFSMLILGQAYVLRRVVGTWLFPGCLFGLFWFGYTFFPLCLLFWVPVDPYAIGFIFLCTLAFSIGCVPFDWKRAFEKNANKRDTDRLMYDTAFLNVFFGSSVVASLLFLVLNLRAQGFSVYAMLFNVLSTATSYADLHFSGDLRDTAFDQLCLVFSYLTAIAGGLLFPCARTKGQRRLTLILSFVPSLFVALTESSKGLLFLCIAFFYAGTLVHRVSEGNMRLLESGRVKLVALYGAVLLGIVTVALFARGLGNIQDNNILANRLLYYYASYSCGHIYAFADWFAFTVGRHSTFNYAYQGTSYGFYTFLALLAKLGFHRTVPGNIFDEFYIYKDLLSSNIYTVFRGLILDFGLVGAVLFTAVVGFVSHLSFNIMLRHKKPVFTVAVFVFMIAYFYMSFIISALVWLNMYVAFILLLVALQTNKFFFEQRGTQWL